MQCEKNRSNHKNEETISDAKEIFPTIQFMSVYHICRKAVKIMAAL